MQIYSSYYPSVPTPDESVFSFLFGSRNKFPDVSPAFIDGPSGRVVTRAELKHLALSLAWGVRKHLTILGGIPLNRGDIVMIFSPNSITWPIVLFGSVAAGLKVTLANSSYTPTELKHQWTDSGAKLIFAHPTLVPTVLTMFELINVGAADAKKRIIIADWNEKPTLNGYLRTDDLIGQQSLKEEEKFMGSQVQETVYLCYSSGTTGQPKGVETTHKNVVSVVSIVKPGFLDGIASNEDVHLGVLPFYHIYGAILLLHFPLSTGTPVVIMPRFEPDAFCSNIERYKVTGALVVPPICLALIHHPATTKYSWKSFKFLVSGAAPLGASLVEALHKRLLSIGTDVVIAQGYGLTETSPSTHLLTPETFKTKVGSIGPLLPNLEARLVVDGEADAKEGEPGELWIRGPTVMKGYLNNVAATKNAITPDGWFKTGDVATRDKDGWYFIVDRLKELIKYKGFQVPPAELEAVLIQHPEIVDAAVIGVYSVKDATELPRAYIVVKHPLKTAEECIRFGESVQEWIKTRVAAHKYLRGGVIVTDMIPKSLAGKILRKQLRDQAKKELGGQLSKL